MKNCFFIGHREVSHELDKVLEETIERHIVSYGAKEFIVGNYGEFDRMVAGKLADAKERHPEITLLLLSPYHPTERKVILPRGFDMSLYPPDIEKVPKRYSIVRANMYMIKHCDYLIAYVWHNASNARTVMEKAESFGTVKIENLADIVRNKEKTMQYNLSS